MFTTPHDLTVLTLVEHESSQLLAWCSSSYYNNISIADIDAKQNQITFPGVQLRSKQGICYFLTLFFDIAECLFRLRAYHSTYQGNPSYKTSYIPWLCQHGDFWYFKEQTNSETLLFWRSFRRYHSDWNSLISTPKCPMMFALATSPLLHFNVNSFP